MQPKKYYSFIERDEVQIGVRPGKSLGNNIKLKNHKSQNHLVLFDSNYAKWKT